MGIFPFWLIFQTIYLSLWLLVSSEQSLEVFNKIITVLVKANKWLRAWGAGGKWPFLFFNLNWLSFNWAIGCFLQIFKIQNDFWYIAGQSWRLQQVPYGRCKLKLQKKTISQKKSISSYVFWNKYLKFSRNFPWYI